jgi:hypothetical protein
VLVNQLPQIVHLGASHLGKLQRRQRDSQHSAKVGVHRAQQLFVCSSVQWTGADAATLQQVALLRLAASAWAGEHSEVKEVQQPSSKLARPTNAGQQYKSVHDDSAAAWLGSPTFSPFL